MKEAMLNSGRKMYRHLILTAIVVSLAACAKNAGPDIGTVSPPLTPPAPQAPTVQGTINGGGGAGLRCGDKLEVLDLYEARKAGLQLVPAPQTSAEAVTLVAVRVANHFWNPETIPLENYMKTWADGIVAPIMEGRSFKNYATGKYEDVLFVESLPLSNDYGKYEVPVGCQLEQIAYFSDEFTKLSIVRSSWAKLDFFSKAILVAHELVYMVNRREGVETLLGEKAHSSEFSRRFVGRLFANSPLPAKADSLPTDGSLRRCSTANAELQPTFFYAFQDSNKMRTTFIFKTVLGHSSPYQLRSDFEQQATEAAVVAVGIVKSEDDTRITVRVTELAGKDSTIEFLVPDGGPGRSLSAPQSFTCEKF